MHLSIRSDNEKPALASIITTCKGRVRHLRSTLPTMLTQECSFPYEIIVVDYGCPDGTFEWCRSLNLQGLTVLRVEGDTSEFNRSHSHNVGGVSADGELLAFVDADMRLHPHWLAHATRPCREGQADLVIFDERYGHDDRFGTCVVTKRLFRTVRGYDEFFSGWAFEDDDFYSRCRSHGRVGRFDGLLLNPIRHSNSLRVQFHRVKSTYDSSLANGQYMQEKGVHSLRNPGGFGKALLKKFNGSEAMRRQDWERLMRYSNKLIVPRSSILVASKQDHTLSHEHA